MRYIIPSPTAELLTDILDKYNDQRVLVVAPPCAGKSTLLQHIPTGVDMDMVFDTMPAEFRRYVLHHEYPFMYIDGDRETVKYTERPFIPGDPESEGHLRTTLPGILTSKSKSHPVSLCLEQVS